MIQELIKQTIKPALYEKGNAVMWTDPHISKQLLEVHLSEHTDLASRKNETIKSTVDWVLSHCKDEALKILDLGCGPGLYSEMLAKLGHHVTGVDFSQNSIEYARKKAESKNLQIKYLNKDYTKLELPENQFDLVILVYTDFGPLLPGERELLLKKIKTVLKPGGLFIFDVLNDKNISSKVSPKNWEASEKGFWSENPYLALSESFLYEEEKVVLYQHIISDDGNTKVYRFWNHFFSETDVKTILEKNGFGNVSFHQNVIPAGDGYKSEDVTFCIVINN